MLASSARRRGTMSRDDAISFEHVQGVLAFLDQLHLGFVLIDPAGALVHLSYVARRFLGRRARLDTVQELLGASWDELVTEVLDGRSQGARWREVRAPGLSGGGDPLHVSVRSTAVLYPGGASGALLSLFDVSAEVGMHARYNATLARLEQANEDLRRQIAQVLREHEDDLSQFDELLAIAPAIFASFVAEAEGAVAEVAALVSTGGQLAAEAIDGGLRATHTLKGNARGLGLHFIAGRAHAVEGLLLSARPHRAFASVDEAEGAVGDLERAVARAGALRGRLSAAGGGDPGTLQTARALVGAAGRLEAALAALPADHEARRHIRDALATIDPLCLIPIGQIFEYLRVTARDAAEAAGRAPPDVEHDGGEIAVPPTIHAVLAQALPHLVRNAVVHGLEPAEARVAAGKAAAGRIRLVAAHDGERLIVRVGDDGRGLDRQALRARAAELGLAAAAADDDGAIDALIFHAGLSTAAALTMDAGRGYGTSAARAEVEALGGVIEVRSSPGAGVELELVIPLVSRRDPAPG